MNVIILQGPNLNLIGLVSAKSDKSRITIQKINKGIRSFAQHKKLNIKTLQTHSINRAITFIQGNRQWADAYIIAPSSWYSYEISLKNVLEIIDKPVIEVFFAPPFEEFGTPKQSVFSNICSTTITNSPETVFSDALDYISKNYL